MKHYVGSDTFDKQGINQKKEHEFNATNFEPRVTPLREQRIGKNSLYQCASVLIPITKIPNIVGSNATPIR